MASASMPTRHGRPAESWGLTMTGSDLGLSVSTLDRISLDEVKTLAGLFRERVRRAPEAPAYGYYDESTQTWRPTSWRETAEQVARWQAALQGEGLAHGDRVALMLGNCREWVWFEQAALGLGLVVVPLYVNDRPENAAYILNDAGVKILLIAGAEQWQPLVPLRSQLTTVQRVVSVQSIANVSDEWLCSVSAWVPAGAAKLQHAEAEPHELASIVYTSGTTGNPKGVMLSHHNILWNAHSAAHAVAVYPSDVFLSFLPLSHTFERTAGYYLAMICGAQVVYARSIPQLGEDMLTVRPTVLVSVPRIFERIHARVLEQLQHKPALAQRMFVLAVSVGWQRFQHLQGRASWRVSQLLWPLLEAAVARKLIARLGGRVRVAVCGGAPLSPDISRVFCGLGLPLLQGYGLTETSPVVSTNRLDNNDPASIGPPIDDVEVRIGVDGELLIRGPGVCLGYWNKPEATQALIDAEGWLHSGDQAKIENGRIYITGRLKEIIVLANGEKVPPADMEAAIQRDPLFDQVMVLGEGKPYLSVLAVLNAEQWAEAARRLGVATHALDEKSVQQWALERIARQMSGFPGYAQVRRAALSLEPWTVENGLLTPTLKMRRGPILERCDEEVSRLYAGH